MRTSTRNTEHRESDLARNVEPVHQNPNVSFRKPPRSQQALAALGGAVGVQEGIPLTHPESLGSRLLWVVKATIRSILSFLGIFRKRISLQVHAAEEVKTTRLLTHPMRSCAAFLCEYCFHDTYSPEAKANDPAT